MKRDDLFRPAADWSGETWAGRIDQCASMLFVHGYIPQSTRERIATKLTRECEAAASPSSSSHKEGAEK